MAANASEYTLKYGEYVSYRLMCKLLYVDSVRSKDPAIVGSADAVVLANLKTPRDWAQRAMHQSPKNKQIGRSDRFYDVLREEFGFPEKKVWHDFETAKRYMIELRFSSINITDPLLLPMEMIAASEHISPIHTLQVFDTRHDQATDTRPRTFYIPAGACYRTSGLITALKSSAASNHFALCDKWSVDVADSSKDKDVKLKCPYGAACTFIHADPAAIRRCALSVFCPNININNKCPYAHGDFANKRDSIWSHVGCLIKNPIKTPTSFASELSDSVGSMCATRCSAFSLQCVNGASCKYQIVRCEYVHLRSELTRANLTDKKAKDITPAPMPKTGSPIRQSDPGPPSIDSSTMSAAADSQSTPSPVHPRWVPNPDDNDELSCDEHTLDASTQQLNESSCSSSPDVVLSLDLLKYAFDQAKLPKFSNGVSRVALPDNVIRRLKRHEQSFERRTHGDWLRDACAKGDAAIWLLLPNTKEPSRVWYLNKIGEGSCSTVYLGVQEGMGRPVAVKIFTQKASHTIQKRIQDNNGEFSEAFRLSTQSDKHAGLVKYIDHVQFESPHGDDPDIQVPRFALVTELMNVSLSDLKLRWEAVGYTSNDMSVILPSIARQLLTTIRDFHTVPDANARVMVHNDINLENVMMDCTGNARIIDVGISRLVSDTGNKVDDTMDSKIRDTVYRPPEVVEALKQIAQKIPDASGNLPTVPVHTAGDVFSLGWTLFQLGLPSINFQDRAPNPHFRSCLAHFTERSTQKRFEDRPTCAQLLNYPLLWSTEKCVMFLANFINPFLPVNNGGDTSIFEAVSMDFLNRNECYRNWSEAFGCVSNPSAVPKKALIEFWSRIEQFPDDLSHENSRHDSYLRHSPRQFQLLRLINNHVHSHHKPHIPEAALLEAFPNLVVNIYEFIRVVNTVEVNGANVQLGTGVQDYLEAIASAKASRIHTTVSHDVY